MYKLWKRITGLNEVVLAVLLCTAIENYDFTVYGMLSSVIAQVFFSEGAFLFDQGEGSTYLSTLMGFLVFASAFVARPLGATMFGYLGDRKGRRLALNISAGMLVGSVFFMSVLPTPTTWSLSPIVLIVLRIIQGLSYGAEIGGVVLMAESVGRDQVKVVWVIRIILCSVGILVGTFVLRVCEATLTKVQMHEWGWRIPFFIAAAASCFLPYLRSRIHESPDYLEYKSTGRKENILKSLLQNAGGVLLVFAMGALSSGFFYLSLVCMDMGHRSGILEYVISLLLLMLASYASLLVSDANKRKSCLLAVLAIIVVAMYPVVHFIYEGSMIARMAFFVMFGSYWGWYGPFVVLMFPVGARQTCFSAPYSAGYLLGGFSPAICLWLSHATGLDGVPAFYLISFAVTVFVMVALFLRVEDGSYKFVLSGEGGGGEVTAPHRKLMG
ncbi:MFS transporter [Anaplasma marginale]|uniref:MFS transporter n=1 Tax=Anaplasma marginale TaxID=770 RepID=UPI000DEF16C6|nr:MFS transporter [Anaplasma marginale]RCL20224.1 MFS transporter [Anaplasma marginale]